MKPNISIDEQQQQQLLALRELLKDADEIKCEKCGCSNYINVYRIRKISGLAAGTGKDVIVPIPVYACADCGHINSAFMSSSGLERTSNLEK